MRRWVLALAVLAGIAGWQLATLAAPQQTLGPTPGLTPQQLANATGAVSGVVTDATSHKPIKGVSVYLGPPPRGGGRTAYQLTDDRGRFVFTGVAPGTYFINASRSGYDEAHFGPGTGGTLGGYINLADGQWFNAANFDMTRLGAIGGTVVDEHGEPAVGVYVRVLVQLKVAGQTRVVTGPSTKTDDRGEYRIPNLGAGKYIVMVPSVQSTVPSDASVPDVEGLTADQMARNEQAAATRGAPPPQRRNGGAIVDGTSTLIIGNYFTPPPAVDGRAQAYPVTFYPSATSLATATPVTLEAGTDRSGINLTLQAVPAVRVSGHLEGAPDWFKGVVVRLLPTGLEDLGTSNEAATSLVRPDGTFTFLSVTPGAYTLLAQASTFELRYSAGSGFRSTAVPLTPGFRSTGSSSGGVVGGGPSLQYSFQSAIGDPTAAGTGFMRMPLTVGTTDVSDVTVALQRTTTIHGKVVYEDTTGTIPPLIIADLDPATMTPGMSRYTGVSNRNADGSPPDTFTIPDIRPGEYVLRLTQGTIKSIVVDGEDVSRRPIVAGGGRDLDLTIAVTGKVAKLSGTVRDAQGAPVMLGSAMIFPTDKRLWANYGFSPTWIRSSVATSNGAYQLTNLKAGEYFVVGVGPADINAWQDPAFLEAASQVATRITLDWGDAKTLDVKLFARK